MRVTKEDGKKVYVMTEEEYANMARTHRREGQADVRKYMAFWFQNGVTKQFNGFSDMLSSLGVFLNGDTDMLPNNAGVGLTEFSQK